MVGHEGRRRSTGGGGGGGGGGTWQLDRRQHPHRLRCHRGAKEPFARRVSKRGCQETAKEKEEERVFNTRKEGENDREVKKGRRDE